MTNATDTDETTDLNAVGTDAANDRQEQILSTIRKGNEFTVKKIRAVAEAVPAVKLPTPKLPAPKIGEPRIDVPKLREDALAYARKLPAPVDVVESAFGLADRLVAERRKFADEIKKALRSVGEKTAAATAGADEPVEGEIVETDGK